MKLLHYEKLQLHDQADWIVLIHGAGGNINTWKHQVDDLKQHFNLLMIDLRDHGHSKNIQPPFGSYSFDIIVDDIEKLLDAVEIKKAHFLTLSFGSVLLQALYERFPEKVDRMIIIGGIFNANWMIKGFVHLARFFNIFLSYPAMYGIFSYLLMPKKRNQAARKVYQLQAKKLSEDEYLKWLGLYSEFFLLLRSFHKQHIEQRMLINMGVDDYLFLPSAKHFARGKPLADLVLIDQAGHICNIERPKAVNVEILNFLSDQKHQAQRPMTKAMSGTN